MLFDFLEPPFEFRFSAVAFLLSSPRRKEKIFELLKVRKYHILARIAYLFSNYVSLPCLGLKIKINFAAFQEDYS
jgi:hypothetical protein